MTRYTAIAEAKHQLTRAETAWRELVALVHEEAAKPGYGGPSPASVQRILDEIATTKVATDYWLAAVAMRANQRTRRMTVRRRALEIIRRPVEMSDPPTRVPRQAPAAFDAKTSLDFTEPELEALQRALAEVLPKDAN